MISFLLKTAFSFIVATLLFFSSSLLKATDQEQEPPSPKSLTSLQKNLAELKAYEIDPSVIWAKVFTFLSVEELRTVRYVCKKWCLAVCDPSLWKGKEIIFLSPQRDSEQKQSSVQDQFPSCEQASNRNYFSWPRALTKSFKKKKANEEVMYPVTFSLEALQCPIEMLKTDLSMLLPSEIKGSLKPTALRKLTITRYRPIACAFETILLFTNLETLKFSEKCFKSHLFGFIQGISFLTSLTNLQTLELPDNDLKSQGAKSLKDFITLTSLNLSENSIEDQGLCYLTSLTRLVHLNLEGNSIKDVRVLENFSSLESLNLHVNRINDDNLALLCTTLTKLSNLALGNNMQLTPQGQIQSLAQMTALTRLTVFPEILVPKVEECTKLTSLKLLKETDLFWMTIPEPSLEILKLYFPDLKTLIERGNSFAKDPLSTSL